MNPKELLSLLTARVQRFHLAPGGTPALIAEDIAHALGMIKNDEARIYARVKYCEQFEYAEGVALAIRRFIMQKKLEASWRIPRPDFLLDLSLMILAEAIDPHICPWCAGRGNLILDREQAAMIRGGREGQNIVCELCRGSRQVRMRDIDRANLMRISKQSWSQSWKGRYQETQAETVDAWESGFAGAISARINASYIYREA